MVRTTKAINSAEMVCGNFGFIVEFVALGLCLIGDHHPIVLLLNIVNIQKHLQDQYLLDTPTFTVCMYIYIYVCVD